MECLLLLDVEDRRRRHNGERHEGDSGVRPSACDEQPRAHGSDAAAGDGDAKQVQAEQLEHVEPARKVLVEADAVDDAEDAAHLVEADDDLELGLQADLGLDAGGPLPEAAGEGDATEPSVDGGEHSDDDDKDDKDASGASRRGAGDAALLG